MYKSKATCVRINNNQFSVCINSFYLFIVKDVTGGKVDIDLSIMSMIKIKKQLDLCSVLGSDVMGHKDCPLAAGDLELDATGNNNYTHFYYVTY